MKISEALYGQKVEGKCQYTNTKWNGTVIARKEGMLLLGFEKGDAAYVGAWIINVDSPFVWEDYITSSYKSPKELRKMFYRGYWVPADTKCKIVSEEAKKEKKEPKKKPKKKKFTVKEKLNQFELGTIVKINDTIEGVIMAIHEPSKNVLVVSKDKDMFNSDGMDFLIDKDINASEAYKDATCEEIKKQFKSCKWYGGTELAEKISDTEDSSSEEDKKDENEFAVASKNIQDLTETIKAMADKIEANNNAFYEKIGSQSIIGQQSSNFIDAAIQSDGIINVSVQFDGKEWKVLPSVATSENTKEEKFEISHNDLNTWIDLFSDVWANEVVVNKTIENYPAPKSTFKSNLSSAAYRVATTQILKGVKSSAISLMESGGHENIKALSELLDTEIGTALLSAVIGHSLTAANIKDERIQKIAEEFRIAGYSIAGNFAFDTVLQSIAPIVKDALSGISKEQVRVALPVIDTTKEEANENEERTSENLTSSNQSTI